MVDVNVVPPDAITTGSLQQEIWTNIGNGTAVSDLTSRPKFPQRPDGLRALCGFVGSPVQAFSDADCGAYSFVGNYGSRIRSYLTPTNTGAYTFFIASADESRLMFSFNTNPLTATIIAWVGSATGYQEWTRSSSQQSGFMWLVAGQAGWGGA